MFIYRTCIINTGIVCFLVNLHVCIWLFPSSTTVRQIECPGMMHGVSSERRGCVHSPANLLSLQCRPKTLNHYRGTSSKPKKIITYVSIVSSPYYSQLRGQLPNLFDGEVRGIQRLNNKHIKRIVKL